MTLPDGQVVRNPVRVMADDGGSEVVFTVRRLPGVRQADFEADVAAVEKDLATLKQVLEESGKR